MEPGNIALFSSLGSVGKIALNTDFSLETYQDSYVLNTQSESV